MFKCLCGMSVYTNVCRFFIAKALEASSNFKNGEGTGSAYQCIQTSMSKLAKTSCHLSPGWGWAGGCFVTIEPLLGDTFVTFSAKNWEQCGQRPDSVLAAASGAIGKWADCQHQ